MSYAIRITRSNGVQSVHPLGEGQVTLGSDPCTDICITDEAGLLPQHVLLAPRDGKCWVSTAKDSPLWDRSGVAVSGTYVSWGSRLTLGKCVFELCKTGVSGKPPSRRNQSDTSADKASETTELSRARIHPGFLMLLFATLAYVALQGFGSRDSDPGMGLAETPALFAEESRTCQGANPSHRAPIAEEQALAKSERSVFDLYDGVLAVELFFEAEDCYRKAGQSSAAEYVLETGVAFRDGMQEEYDLLRLRLSRDLEANNTASARAQVRRLSELLRHRADTDYGLALRRLSARLAKQGQTL